MKRDYIDIWLWAYCKKVFHDKKYIFWETENNKPNIYEFLISKIRFVGESGFLLGTRMGLYDRLNTINSYERKSMKLKF